MIAEDGHIDSQRIPIRLFRGWMPTGSSRKRRPLNRCKNWVRFGNEGE